ncbi:MAG: FtsX-like permease family protein, partial [Pseudomonadota bacterium]
VFAQRQDVTLTFFEPRSLTARHALARVPGVRAVEPVRRARADISFRGRTHRGAITGLAPGATLQVVDDSRGRTFPVPLGGMVVGSMLAEKLGLAVGDRLDVKILDGARPRLSVPVAGITEGYIDTPVYMAIGPLNRALGEGELLDSAHLLVDPAEHAAFYAAVRELPGLAAVTEKSRAMQKLYETIGESVLIFIGFFTVFAGALAAGVIYNALRIALSERGRELATLRVLGFHRAEIAYLLFGEAALLILAAIPFGIITGIALSALMAEAFATELFRLPLTITPEPFAQSILTVLAAAVVSAVLVRRRLHRLDLIGVLKTRE